MRAFKSAIGMVAPEESDQAVPVKTQEIPSQAKAHNPTKSQTNAAKSKPIAPVTFDPKELFNFGDQP